MLYWYFCQYLYYNQAPNLQIKVSRAFWLFVCLSHIWLCVCNLVKLSISIINSKRSCSFHRIHHFILWIILLRKRLLKYFHRKPIIDWLMTSALEVIHKYKKDQTKHMEFMDVHIWKGVKQTNCFHEQTFPIFPMLIVLD